MKASFDPHHPVDESRDLCGSYPQLVVSKCEHDREQAASIGECTPELSAKAPSGMNPLEMPTSSLSKHTVPSVQLM